MYGYVVPDKTKIKQEEYILYAAFYCGLCKTLGRNFGQIPRYTTNYDMTFFAVLAFDQLNEPAEFNKERCAGNPFNKKAILMSSPLMDRIADLNIIFTYYKAVDNVADGEGGGSAAKLLFKKHYKSAKEREPELDGIIGEKYKNLRVLEAAREPGIDRASDCFASMLRDCAAGIMGGIATDDCLRLVYNVGKFVYLADALDDISEDGKKKRYNPFLSALGGFGRGETRSAFISRNLDTLTFVFASTVNRAIECFNGIKFNQSYGLLENIIYYGLRMKTEELFKSKRKLKNPKI